MKKSSFAHKADKLGSSKKVVFTAQSAKNFHQRMLICKFVFEQGAVPINPFTNFGYFLYELVDRDLVREGNNTLLERSDELWVFGDVSNGVLSEIKRFRKSGKPIKYYHIAELPLKVKECQLKDLEFEPDIAKHKKDFC